MRPETRVGYDDAYAIVDDHSRLAYVELHDDETAQTVTGFVEHSPSSPSTGITIKRPDSREGRTPRSAEFYRKLSR